MSGLDCAPLLISAAVPLCPPQASHRGLRPTRMPDLQAAAGRDQPASGVGHRQKVWLHRSGDREKHGSLKFHGGEAWGRGVQGAFGAYSGCILPSLVVSSLSRPRSLLFASCCLLFWRVFVRSLRELAGFKEGSLRRLRSFILAIFASKDGRRS